VVVQSSTLFKYPEHYSLIRPIASGVLPRPTSQRRRGAPWLHLHHRRLGRLRASVLWQVGITTSDNLNLQQHYLLSTGTQHCSFKNGTASIHHVITII